MKCLQTDEQENFSMPYLSQSHRSAFHFNQTNQQLFEQKETM